MKGKITRFSGHDHETQRTGILIKVDGNGEQWFSHYGSTDKLKPYKKQEFIEFTAEKDKITSMKKIRPKAVEAMDDITKEPALTPKANSDKMFSNETATIQLSYNAVAHFMTKNEGTKTLKKELFLKVYEQLKLDERTRLISELRRG